MNMISPDVAKRIKEIEITTRRLLTGGLVGENQAAVKGSGFDFDQIRDYQVGDDIRFIDWKSSARADKLLIKQYVEERTLNIMLAVDVSSSTHYTSHTQTKSEYMTEIAAVLAYSAIYTKNNVGAVFFSSKVETCIPLGNDIVHARNLVTSLYTHKQKKEDTCLAAACHYIVSLSLKNTVVFIISDFIDATYTKALQILAKKHDVVAVRCLDPYEKALPSIGFLTVEDAETKERYLLDTRNQSNSFIKQFLTEYRLRQQGTIHECNADMLDIQVGRPFITDIIRFLRKRMVQV